jgi:thiamine pyrophosphate-dependent acetolactate synthase large subunit-like protein
MDELNIEDLKQLVIFYNKRTTDAESKNAEFQLITNRLKIENASLESRIKNLESEIKKLSEKPEPVVVKKTTEKKTKAKA